MSACSDFVEHIWKPGSCKNCFCLRSDHQLTAGRTKARASSLPTVTRLPARPENCRLEEEGVNGLAYSKPTIAVKPTMMSSETSDLWTEAGLGADVSKVRLTNPAPVFTGAVPLLTHGSWLAAREATAARILQDSCLLACREVAIPGQLLFGCSHHLPISSFRVVTISLVHTDLFPTSLETDKRESKNKEKQRLKIIGCNVRCLWKQQP